MPATIEAAIIARLKSTSGVNTPTAGRIYSTLDTADVDVPQVVATKAGADAGSALDSARSLKRYTITVDVYAETELEAVTIAGAARVSLEAWSGDGVSGCFHEDSSGSSTEDGLRVQIDSYGVWFQPT